MDAIADDWRALQSRTEAHLFSCYDWIRDWWETIGQNSRRSLHIVTATRNERLVGILPLMVEKRCYTRILEWAGNEIYDYCSTLAEDDDVVSALWETARNSSLYDLALIKDVRPASRDAEHLASFAVISEFNNAPYISLTWKNGDAWRASCRPKQRRNFNVKSKKLKQKGPVSFEIIRTSPAPKDLIDTMVQHKTAWFHDCRKVGIFSNPHIKEIFHRMVLRAAEQGKMFLGVLKCGDKPVSHLFGFIERSTLQCYFTSYDPEWRSYSTGLLVFMHSMYWAIDNGIKEFDFMRGTEDYKFRNATDVRELPVFSFARTFKGRLANVVFRWHRLGTRHIKTVIKLFPSSALKGLLILRQHVIQGASRR